MKNDNICTICTQKPSDYATRDICGACADKYAKVYYKHKVDGVAWPDSMPVIENMQEADILLDDADNDVRVHWGACSKAGHIGLKMPDGACAFCALGRDATPLRLSPRQQAIADGETQYTPTQPCPRCDTTALKRVDNGACSGCVAVRREKAVSPRQQALMGGEIWYTPTTPCPRCNTVELRHVDNGACKGCQALRKTRKTPVNTLPADTIVSKADAFMLGFKFYRTGHHCLHGHTGFRLVSTGACVDCQTKISVSSTRAPVPPPA